MRIQTGRYGAKRVRNLTKYPSGSKQDISVVSRQGKRFRRLSIYSLLSGSTEVLITDVLLYDLCAAGLHLCLWSQLTQPVFPRVLGHEGVGIVESLGEGIDPKQLKVGDMVIPTYLGECKECENCTSGRTNLCVTYPLQAFTGLMPDGTSRMSSSTANGGGVRSLYHFLSCSTWSQYTVVDANYVVKVDPRIPLPHASFLSCGFTTGFGATWKEAKIQKGASTVAVLGLGAVGLGAIEGARVHGATKIIGVDINESKCEIGKAFGMTHYINPRGEEASGRSISELVKELTDGKGVDFSFECTGVPELVNQALESTKVGLGRMIMLGAGTQKTIDIDFGSLLCCREFKYSVFGGVKVQSDLPVIIGKCIDKEIQKLDHLQTYEVHFEDIHKAFELLKEPDCVKVLIKL